MVRSWSGVPLVMMADYLADPMWVRSPSGRGGRMVPLEELPLSADLVGRLRAWAGVFDDLARTNYEWPSAEAHLRWIDTGRSLCEEARAELGDLFDVAYFHDRDISDHPGG
jgi:hypothetical protein